MPAAVMAVDNNRIPVGAGLQETTAVCLVAVSKLASATGGFLLQEFELGRQLVGLSLQIETIKM